MPRIGQVSHRTGFRLKEWCGPIDISLICLADMLLRILGFFEHFQIFSHQPSSYFFYFFFCCHYWGFFNRYVVLLGNRCRYFKRFTGLSILVCLCAVLQEAVSTGDPEMVQLVLQRRDYLKASTALGGVPELLSKIREVRFVKFPCVLWLICMPNLNYLT